jgi:hypothetical protein
MMAKKSFSQALNFCSNIQSVQRSFQLTLKLASRLLSDNNSQYIDSVLERLRNLISQLKNWRYDLAASQYCELLVKYGRSEDALDMLNQISNRVILFDVCRTLIRNGQITTLEKISKIDFSDLFVRLELLLQQALSSPDTDRQTELVNFLNYLEECAPDPFSEAGRNVPQLCHRILAETKGDIIVREKTFDFLIRYISANHLKEEFLELVGNTGILFLEFGYEAGWKEALTVVKSSPIFEKTLSRAAGLLAKTAPNRATALHKYLVSPLDKQKVIKSVAKNIRTGKYPVPLLKREKKWPPGINRLEVRDSLIRRSVRNLKEPEEFIPWFIYGWDSAESVVFLAAVLCSLQKLGDNPGASLSGLTSWMDANLLVPEINPV